MVYRKPLKYCLDLPYVNGGCPHWLRSYYNMGITSGRPESQVHQNIERVGFFVLREEWITEEEVQLRCVPRKLARCYGCRTNFVVIWEKYAQLFDWKNIVDGRYAESLFISYNPSLIEEFKLGDEEWKNYKLDNAYVFGIPPQNAQPLAEASSSSAKNNLQSPSEERLDVEASLTLIFASSPKTDCEHIHM